MIKDKIETINPTPVIRSLLCLSRKIPSHKFPIIIAKNDTGIKRLVNALFDSSPSKKLESRKINVPPRL